MKAAEDSRLLLVIDLIDEDTGLADVTDNQGRSYQLPTEWLPDPAEGRAYRAAPHAHGPHFTPDPQGARLLRERSKQTLLDFNNQQVDSEERE